MIAKHKGQLLNHLDGSTSYWQHRLKSAEHENAHQDKPSSQDTKETGIFLLLGILFTIGFLALLTITTLRTIFL